jgi:hypothetical protein
VRCLSWIGADNAYGPVIDVLMMLQRPRRSVFRLFGRSAAQAVPELVSLVPALGPLLKAAAQITRRRAQLHGQVSASSSEAASRSRTRTSLTWASGGASADRAAVKADRSGRRSNRSGLRVCAGRQSYALSA